MLMRIVKPYWSALRKVGISGSSVKVQMEKNITSADKNKATKSMY